MSATPRPVRHFEPPRTPAAWLYVHRYSLARRTVQLGVLLLFFGTLHWGWKAFGAPLLAGNLSAAKFAGVLPMADPFAVLQIVLTRHWPASEALLGAAIVLAFYLLLGGRVFCAWACPVNVVTDAAHWLRDRLDFGRDLAPVDTRTRYVVLLVALVLSALAGVAAFEWVSPIALLHRELIYGAGLGLTAALGIFVLDAFVLKHGWCGRLCPLGAFWSLFGRAGQVKVAFDDASCTRCGDCVRVCPEPRVLNFNQMAVAGLVVPGECTNCARCIVVCPENSLRFALRARAKRQPGGTA